MVSSNNLCVRIGKQWKSIPELLRVPSVNIRLINTDADDTNAARVVFRKPMLETPQLGVAERSPKTSIENEEGTLRVGKQIAKAYRFSILIQ